MANRNVGVSYRQHSLEDRWDAIVIGSGIGGLASAALLARHGGKKVLVLERHYVAGGFTQVFHRPDYEWDVGVHYIGKVHDPASQERKMFDHITEGRLAWNPMPEVYDRVVIADRTYEFVSGLERFRERLKDYFPGEAAAIDNYMALVQTTAQAARGYFAEKALPASVAALIGPLLRRKFMGFARRTTAEVLRELTGNEELIAMLTAQWGDYGLPPAQSSFGIHAVVANHYFDGASYPVGGAGQIAAAIAPGIERNGGKIVVGAEVAEILLDRSNRATGVRMADGREFHAPAIVSDTGARNTFVRLLPTEARAKLRFRKQLEDLPASAAHLCLYVGLKQNAGESFGESNLWVHRSPDHDGNATRFFADPGQPFPFVFISFPSAKDPTFARRYPMRSTIEVVAPAPYASFERWEQTKWKHRGPEYEELKEQLKARLLTELEQAVPAVKGKVDYSELSSPLSTRHFMNYELGEAYGIATTPARFGARFLRAATPLANLYLTGQDVGSLGLTGALFGGAITASALLRRNLLGQI
jgi:all-trans-retinol 13,14-reductase